MDSSLTFRCELSRASPEPSDTPSISGVITYGNAIGNPVPPTPPQTYDDSRNYASVTGNIAGEDFVALLMGEVSGNWVPVGSRPLAVGGR